MERQIVKVPFGTFEEQSWSAGKKENGTDFKTRKDQRFFERLEKCSFRNGRQNRQRSKRMAHKSRNNSEKFRWCTKQSLLKKGCVILHRNFRFIIYGNSVNKWHLYSLFWIRTRAIGFNFHLVKKRANF